MHLTATGSVIKDAEKKKRKKENTKFNNSFHYDIFQEHETTFNKVKTFVLINTNLIETDTLLTRVSSTIDIVWKLHVL